jgi:hypothetical protein
MMDATRLYPKGWHPQQIGRRRDWKGKAKHCERTFHPPKYYFIDFGISRQYDPFAGPPREEPIWGGDKTVPEFHRSDDPCDPFPTDVYYLGNMIRRDFLEVSVQVPELRMTSSPLFPGMERPGNTRTTRSRIHVPTRRRHGARRPDPTSCHGPGCRSLRGHTAGAKHPETPFSDDSPTPQRRRSMVPSRRALVPTYKIHRVPYTSCACNLSSPCL